MESNDCEQEKTQAKTIFEVQLSDRSDHGKALVRQVLNSSESLPKVLQLLSVTSYWLIMFS
jgi:hypothetical protein